MEELNTVICALSVQYENGNAADASRTSAFLDAASRHFEGRWAIFKVEQSSMITI